MANFNFKPFIWFLTIFVIKNALSSNFLGKLYKKVSNVLPASVDTCFLSKVNVQHVFSCLNKCTEEPLCKLACFNGNVCELHSASISMYWDGAKYPEITEKEFFQYYCFSSWVFNGDITGHIININSSLPDNEYVPNERGVDGYQCSLSQHLYASTLIDDNPWYEVQLDRIYKVSKVIVIPRTEDIVPTEFENVEVRVGNVEGENGDFTKNQIFYYYKGMAAPNETIVMEAPPLYGSFVSLKILHAGWLIFEDLKIISDN